jgi:pimeloyl-ACP methyl ester carboxylesterase
VGQTAEVATADGSDLKAALELAGRGLGAATAMVRDVHVAIARRAFTASGPASRPAHLMHDAISRKVYTAVGGGARIAATVSGVAVAARAAGDPSYRPLADRPRGNVVVGAVNGAWGDFLARTGSPLALRMSVRVRGRDVGLTREQLAAAHPGATGDVVVFLHGLCETDASWALGALKRYGDATSTHGSRLSEELGVTPVFLRYNTGLHISDNGAQLSALLTELVDQWPVPLRRLTLIGHSMGGLVIRSASHVGCESDAPWIALTKRIVYLGSPHLGAPLEIGAARAARAMRRLPETKPVGDALAGRSLGIKDLRFGDVLATDWADIDDLDAERPEPGECPALLDGAEHYYIGATISRRHDTVAARVIGDALVPFASASGSGKVRRLGLDVDRGRHLGGLHHFDLLNHPRVYDVVKEWLAR